MLDNTHPDASSLVFQTVSCATEIANVDHYLCYITVEDTGYCISHCFDDSDTCVHAVRDLLGGSDT